VTIILVLVAVVLAIVNIATRKGLKRAMTRIHELVEQTALDKQNLAGLSDQLAAERALAKTLRQTIVVLNEHIKELEQQHEQDGGTLEATNAALQALSKKNAELAEQIRVLEERHAQDEGLIEATRQERATFFKERNEARCEIGEIRRHIGGALVKIAKSFPQISGLTGESMEMMNPWCVLRRLAEGRSARRKDIRAEAAGNGNHAAVLVPAA
jgi:chromosome segregation ATPase